MAAHKLLKWMATAVLALFSQQAWVESTDDSLFTVSISGLHRFSNTLDTIKDKGFGTYLGDQLTQAGRNTLPEVFGSSWESAEKAITAGEHAYDMHDRGIQTLNRQIDAGSGSEAVAEMENYYSWLRGEKVPQMLRDVTPKSLLALSDKVRSFADDAGWLADQGEAAMQSGEIAVTSARDRVQSYFSDDSEYGLEPNGRDGKVVAAAVERNGELIPPDLASYAADWGGDDQALLAGAADGNALVDEATQSGSPGYLESEVEASVEPPRGAFADDLAAMGYETETTASALGSFADDLAALEGDSSTSSEPGSLADDVAYLEDDLGTREFGAASGATDWAGDVTEASAATEEWERQEEAERQRQAAILREKQRQEALALQRAQEEARQQAEFARQQQEELDHLRQQRALADAQAREDEQERAEMAQAQAQESRQRQSAADDSGSIWGAVGAVVLGVAAGYYAGKHGIDVPSTLPYATTMPRSSTGGGGGSGNSACDRAVAIIEEYSREINRTSSQCEIGKLSKTYGQRIAASGCPDYASYGRELAENGEARMRGMCSGYN